MVVRKRELSGISRCSRSGPGAPAVGPGAVEHMGEPRCTLAADEPRAAATCTVGTPTDTADSTARRRQAGMAIGEPGGLAVGIVGTDRSNDGKPPDAPIDAQLKSEVVETAPQN